MIAETGHFALILAFVVALVQSWVPLRGAARGDAGAMALARHAAILQFLLIAGAFGALMWSSATNDFSLKVVWENSHSDKPLLYRITGVWGEHEGSMLLWVLILTIYGAAVALFGNNLPAGLRARVLAVQSMIAAGFYLFILLTSDPFERLSPAPVDGQGMNPLLQDPGLAFHPPFLYLGYVGFSMAFSFAIAALIEGRVDAAWARWVRPWTLLAWCFLTTGIAGGSWWSYYTLGWGGFWYWDPVENASLMPWLAGTALLHSAIVVERRDTMKAWTVLLAILTFSLSLLGTFLVRSGVLTSVHAFAVDPSRGAFVLVLLAAATGGSLALFAWRAPTLQPGGLFAPISREGGLLLNNLLLCTAAATVLLGTLYPLLMEAFGPNKISVGPPFFNAVVLPILTPLVAAMAIGPLLSWKRADIGAVAQRLKWAATGAILAAVAAWFAGGGTAGPLWAVGGMALATWAILGSATELAERVRLFRVPLGDSIRRAFGLPGSAWGVVLGHAGMGVLIIGIIGDTAWSSQTVLSMHPGESASLAGYSFHLDRVDENVPGPNYVSIEAQFTVSEAGRFVAVLTPSQRLYSAPEQEVTDAAIRSNILSDLYAVVGDPDGSGGYVVRLYHNPLVMLIFLGAAAMVGGGGLSLADRRHRVGAPRRRGAMAAQPAKA